MFFIAYSGSNFLPDLFFEDYLNFSHETPSVFTLKPQLKQRNFVGLAAGCLSFCHFPAAVCRRSLVIRLAPGSRECSGQRGEQYGAGAQVSQPAGSAL